MWRSGRLCTRRLNVMISSLKTKFLIKITEIIFKSWLPVSWDRKYLWRRDWRLLKTRENGAGRKAWLPVFWHRKLSLVCWDSKITPWRYFRFNEAGSTVRGVILVLLKFVRGRKTHRTWVRHILWIYSKCDEYDISVFACTFDCFVRNLWKINANRIWQAYGFSATAVM